MNPVLRKIFLAAFYTGIFFIPFNSFQGIKELGEFKTESGSYFLLLAFVLLGLSWLASKRIAIPYKSSLFHLLLIFMGWCMITTLLNIDVILDLYFKRTTGVNRFVRQYFVLLISAVAFVAVYWNVIIRMSAFDVLKNIRKAFFCSFVVVSIYGFFEILFVVFGFYPAFAVLQLFNYFPFTEYDVDINGRISSVCFEAPALGTFLITVAGWMFSYILTGKTIWRFAPAAVVILLTYFSGSRTALVVIMVQLLVFLGVVLSRRQKILTALSVSSLALLFAGAIIVTSSDKITRDINKKIESFDFVGNLKKNLSNKSRFGIQYANLLVFADNPVIGVGFGQQAFHALNYYPAWSKTNNWEFKYIYLNKRNPMFAPGYNMYIRLLAETGIIGLLLFGYFLYRIIKRTWNVIWFESGDARILGIILLVSFAGFSMNWLQLDTFRMYGFWLSFAILIKLTFDLKKVK